MFHALHLDEFGIEAGGPSYTSPGPSQPQPSSSVNLDQDQGPASIPPANFNTIQVPPGSHAPANTPADLPHPAGKASHPHWMFRSLINVFEKHAHSLMW